MVHELDAQLLVDVRDSSSLCVLILIGAGAHSNRVCGRWARQIGFPIYNGKVAVRRGIFALILPLLALEHPARRHIHTLERKHQCLRLASCP